MRIPPSASNCGFAVFCILSVVLFWVPLRTLAHLSFHDEKYSHILLIPLISLLLIYLARKRILSDSRYCAAWGVPLVLLGLLLYWIASWPAAFLSENDQLSFVMLAILVVWIAGFVLFYGKPSFRAAAFPLLFLVLMIPIPTVILEKLVSVLQQASAQTAFALFKLLWVPVSRQGFTFSLPGVDIEIAEQCSGIRSSLALFITGIVAGYLFLQSNWRKICLILLTIPVAIFKNAVRIVTISWLGVYVDKGFFYGRLHRQGGLPFALLALAILFPLLLALQRREALTSRSKAGIKEKTSTTEIAQLL